MKSKGLGNFLAYIQNYDFFASFTKKSFSYQILFEIIEKHNRLQIMIILVFCNKLCLYIVQLTMVLMNVALVALYLFNITGYDVPMLSPQHKHVCQHMCQKKRSLNPLTPSRTLVAPFTKNFNSILRRDHQKNFL